MDIFRRQEKIILSCNSKRRGIGLSEQEQHMDAKISKRFMKKK